MYVMTLNQRWVNVYSSLYACWALSLHNVVPLDDGADSKYSHLEVGTAKFDFEFDRTPLKCMGWLDRRRCWETSVSGTLLL